MTTEVAVRGKTTEVAVRDKTTEVAVRDAQSDAGPGPLDPALLQAIRPSATRMAAAKGAFIQLLSEDIGALMSHMPDRGRQVCERTARTVLWLALSDPSADKAIQAVHWLGEENQADGFPQSDYVTVGHALVRVARVMSGLNWTSTTGSDWIRLFMWLQPHLQAGARQQAARQEAARQQAARQEAALQEAARKQAAALTARPPARPPGARPSTRPAAPPPMRTPSSSASSPAKTSPPSPS